MKWNVWKPPGVPMLPGAHKPVTDVEVTNVNSETVRGTKEGKPFSVKNWGDHFWLGRTHYTYTEAT